MIDLLRLGKPFTLAQKQGNVMKKAMVVGIKNYPQCPLHGCENDANAIEEILSRNADKSVNNAKKKVLNVFLSEKQVQFYVCK